MEINIRELNTYLTCSLMWKFKYKDNLIPQKKFLVQDAFDEAIHQAFYYLFNRVSGQIFPSAYHMKLAWGRIWCPGRGMTELLSHIYSNPGKITHNPRFKERQGLDLSLKLLEHYRNKPGIPVLLGKSYRVPIGNHYISGTIELARVVDEDVEIIDMKVAERKATPTQVKHDIELTAASYAFRYLLKTKETRVAYHYLENGTVYHSTRDTEDYKNLVKILNRFEKAIKYDIVMPSMGNCHNCLYKQHCLKKPWY